MQHILQLREYELILTSTCAAWRHDDVWVWICFDKSSAARGLMYKYEFIQTSNIAANCASVWVSIHSYKYQCSLMFYWESMNYFYKHQHIKGADVLYEFILANLPA